MYVHVHQHVSIRSNDTIAFFLRCPVSSKVTLINGNLKIHLTCTKMYRGWYDSVQLFVQCLLFLGTVTIPFLLFHGWPLLLFLLGGGALPAPWKQICGQKPSGDKLVPQKGLYEP